MYARAADHTCMSSSCIHDSSPGWISLGQGRYSPFLNLNKKVSKRPGQEGVDEEASDFTIPTMRKGCSKSPVAFLEQY